MVSAMSCQSFLLSGVHCLSWRCYLLLYSTDKERQISQFAGKKETMPGNHYCLSLSHEREEQIQLASHTVIITASLRKKERRAIFCRQSTDFFPWVWLMSLYHTGLHDRRGTWIHCVTKSPVTGRALLDVTPPSRPLTTSPHNLTWQEPLVSKTSERQVHIMGILWWRLLRFDG